MLVYTPDRPYAEALLRARLSPADPAAASPVLRSCAEGAGVYQADPGWGSAAAHVCCVEHAAASHYDHFVALLGDLADLPDRTLALAGAGSGFHGLRNRPWEARAGNLHLVVCYRPARPVAGFGPGFLALPAVAVAECVDQMPGLAGRAQIKWTNDVLVDGAKVSGVLTHLQAMGSTVTGVVLGIGLNVETRPEVAPSPFVPEVACLDGLAGGPVRLPGVLAALVGCLERNYALLVGGGWRDLVGRYRARSVVIGRRVRIVADSGPEAGQTVAAGLVEAVEDDLSLRLRGRPEPIRHGQLVLEP